MPRYGRLSNGTEFGDRTTWSSDAGQAGMISLTGHVDGDGGDDLVYEKIVSASQIEWHARQSSGSDFSSTYTIRRTDAGNSATSAVRATWTGDGDADLLYGRTKSDSQVVRSAVARAAFDDYTNWRSDAGDDGNLFP
jgi:hypothetical protein